MASIHVINNNTVIKEIPVNQNITTIGRHESNDISMNNPGISGHHAKIIFQNDRYQIIDLRSSNGTFVNGKRIMIPTRLSDGDTIAMSKITLEFHTFSGDKPNVFIDENISEETNNNQTMIVDPSQLSAMLQDHRLSDAEKKGQLMARLNYLDQNKKQHSFLMSKPKVRIGKDPRNDILVKGWFVPKICALIEYQQSSFVLHPKAGKVKLNDEVIHSAQTLKNGDRIKIRSLEIIFNLSTLMGY